MEFKKMLKLTIMICSTICVNCCPRKHNCKKKIESKYCAKLYNEKGCSGGQLNIPEWEGDINDYTGDHFHKVYSREVNEGCVLSLFNSEGSFLGDVTGFNSDMKTHWSWADGHERRVKRMGYAGPQVQSSGIIFGFLISSISCACNKYLGCPNPKTLSHTTSSGESSCGKVYQYSTNDPHTSCFGRSKELFNGEKIPEFTGDDKRWNEDISSVVIRDGCTFTGYENTGYTGHREEFTGVNAELGYLNNKIRSYMCKCDFPPIQCTPSEECEEIARCRNKDGHNVEFGCSYWKTSGISSSETTTDLSEESRSHIFNVGFALKETFKAHYQHDSSSRWSTSNAFTHTKTEEEKRIATFNKIPVGKQYAVYQRVGICGDYKIYENDFELRDVKTQATIQRHN